MVNSNVDLNVIGPESRRVLAKPLFMFAVHTKNVKAQEVTISTL
jgi:hypothetical protein